MMASMGEPNVPDVFNQVLDTALSDVLPENTRRLLAQSLWSGLLAKGELVYEGMSGSRVRTFRMIVDEWSNASERE
jgi:hypothetical protein